MEGGVAGEGEQNARVPSTGVTGSVSPCLNSFPVTACHLPPQGQPATSCGVRDRGDQGMVGPQPCQETQGPWEGISFFPQCWCPGGKNELLGK